MKTFSTGSRKKVLASMALSLVLLTLFMVSGVPVETATGTCHVETRVCHGIPLQQTCIGLESYDRDFEDAGSCQTETIQSTCETAQRTLCERGGTWKDAVVEGFSCGFWDEEYDEIDLKTCEEINQTER